MSILVIGAARSGIAASKLLKNRGYDVILTDTKPEGALKGLEALTGVKKILGRQIETDVLDSVEEIVLSPGVPETIPVIQEAIKREIPIISEIELAFRLSSTPFYAITGTNGKTTITTLLGEIFKDAGREAYTVGNIGDAVTGYIDQVGEEAVFLTEVGSFQLSRCYQFRPEAAIITNITPDHLNRHKTMENYIAAKARIFQNQNENDLLVLNLDDPVVSKMAENSPVKKRFFSLKKAPTEGAYLKGEMLTLVENGEEITLITVEDLGIKGPHNVMNALSASILSREAGIPVESLRKTLKNFKGIPHRQEVSGTIDGVTFINDSKATNTDAAIVALEAMENPTVLIAGGSNKNEAYDKFAKLIRDKKIKAVVLFGETAKDIKSTLENYDYNDIYLVNDLEQAVYKAKSLAESGDTVLLSPACASYDMFNNFEERGDSFKKIVRELKDGKN